MKKYLTHIRIPDGAWCSVGYYADTPNENYRVYYCGSDSGRHYERIGNAARYLEKLAEQWERNGRAVIRDYTVKKEV